MGSVGEKLNKAKRKIMAQVLNKIEGTPLQYALYKSYWHHRFAPKKSTPPARPNHYSWFISQKPNYSAGIGHQLANWNTGFYFAQTYQLAFAHFPFSNPHWESLLGLGEGEMPAKTLLKSSAYKKVRLPRFDSDSATAVALVAAIINSYHNKQILFLLAQDQGYMKQCDTSTALSAKFFAAPSRKTDKLIYQQNFFNIAIHIRRGDIVTMKQAGDASWEARWLNNDYYAAVLRGVLAVLPAGQQYRIYVFSQGTEEEFGELAGFDNLHFCLHMNAYDSFVHLAHADLLISSKSSFSYKPALMSHGIKICPGSFWHAYPARPDFIIADDNGHFDEKELMQVLAGRVQPATELI